MFSLFFDCSLHLSLLPSQQVGEGFLCNARFWSFLQENTSKQHFFLSWAQISVSTDVHVYGQKVPALKCFYFFSLNSLVSSCKCSKIRQHKPSHKSSHLKQVFSYCACFFPLYFFAIQTWSGCTFRQSVCYRPNILLSPHSEAGMWVFHQDSEFHLSSLPTWKQRCLP